MIYVINAAVALLLFAVTGFIISYIIVNYVLYVRFFRRPNEKRTRKTELHDSCYDGCREEILSAAGRMEGLPNERVYCIAKDGVKLSARYYKNGNKKLVMFCHGAHALPWNNFAVIGEDFYKEGYDILLIDERAHWDSGGQFITFGSAESEDVLCWLDMIKGNDAEEIVLYGVSMGATAIAVASDRIADGRVKAMVLDCGFSSLYELEHGIIDKRKVPFSIVSGAFDYGAFRSKALPKEKAGDHLAKTNIPALFVHGGDDAVVDKGQGEENYNACASDNKKFILVEGAGHTLASVLGGKETRDKILKFAKGEFDCGE